ncbi:hypothetical protein GGQ01_000865 [Salinibacter ruber]|uniref:Uncharacterized protein n=1 Tax=Salinibacter ruber TaxID=146919 RepID=A0A9X2ZXW3_9BACT|nr:hypothetical protein [Salinibacter ruber]MCS4195468.1 hypothetical protein [Salinibacter ruber]
MSSAAMSRARDPTVTVTPSPCKGARSRAKVRVASSPGSKRISPSIVSYPTNVTRRVYVPGSMPVML